MKVLAAPVAFNEEIKIARVVDRFQPGLVDELIVVDDGSTDGTRQAVESRGVKVLSHDRRRGVGAAIRTAIRYAQQNNFEVIVILAGNDKDRPAEIPRLVAAIEEGNDFVQGSRYLEGGGFGNMPLYRRLTTQFMHPLLFSLAARRRVTDSTNGFRAMRLSLFDDPRINIDQDWLDQYELEPYIMFKAIRLGHRFKEVPVTKIYPPREQGYTKMKPITGWWSILRPIFLLGLGLKK
ncbi:MAG: glycosyltransferase family 2 protein [Phycisphaerae bacterium]|nr:glycosyltransferase family 2 protein [Phycisphaerae bacterium]